MLWSRLKGRYQRTASQVLARRTHRLRNQRPLISFTFDDFPRSALFIAGAMLEKHGIAGTYYTSFGLMGQVAPTGEIFHRDDLPLVVERGHELGCHTYAHSHAYDTDPQTFEESIVQNKQALRQSALPAEFKTLSYPISCPRPGNKRTGARHYAGCRGGGQMFNRGETDLNNFQSFFIEQSRDNPAAIQQLIAENARASGWLVFSTHDVCANPTRYGCEPALFESIVRYAQESGAAILPVSAALRETGVTV